MKISENDKELVSFDRYTTLLNDELRRQAQYCEGMHFVNLGSGFDLLDRTGTLTATGISALSKLVFDKVSEKFYVGRD